MSLMKREPIMSRRFVCAAWGLVASLSLGVIARAENVEPNAEAAMAWRLDALSSGLLGPDRPPAAFKLSAALLEGAEKLLPTEPRFPRLRSLALQQAGDLDGAIAALVQYRRLNGADPVAQVDLIDLYTAKQQTLDDKVNYLSSLMDKADLQPEVRAQLATQAAVLLGQKSPELAGQMAARAIKLYPLPGATEIYYRYVGRKQQLPERVAALLAVLKANPAQLNYLSELATLLAENGLAEQSLLWYEQVITVQRNSYEPLPPGFHNLVIDYAAEWAIAGKLDSADIRATDILKGQPLDADAWLLHLTVARAQSEESFKIAVDLAQTAFTRRWNRMHGEILSGHASTEPAVPDNAGGEERAPEKIQPLDPAPILQKVQKPGNEGMKAAVVSVASDIAWFELYFDHNADAAGKWIDVLRPLLPADAPTLQRLLGWQALVAGKLPQARAILAKNQDRDPLSKLGVITADRLEKKPIDPATVQTLLDNNRVGLIGAMLWTTFKNEAVRPTSRPSAAAVEAEVNAFPRDALLRVLEPRQASGVYAIEAEPLQTTFEFGTPVLARITISNNSDVDITVGSDALLHPDLWFDASTLGPDTRRFAGVAFDQLQGAIVLRPHHPVTQVVRLDERSLHRFLQDSPDTQGTTVNCWTITNPVPLRDPTTGQETSLPSAGGQAAGFYRTFTYAGVPLSLPSGQQTLRDAMASGSAVQKIHTADLLESYIRQSRKPNADDSQKKLAADLPADLTKLRGDGDALVSGWTNYVSAGVAATPDEAGKIADQMAASPQWSTRLLSLVAGGARPVAMRRQVAQKLINDPDSTVKSAAAAMIEWIDEMPPEGAPTSQPTTVPAAP